MLEIIVLLIFIALIVCNKLIIKQVGRPSLVIPGVCFDEDEDDEDDIPGINDDDDEDDEDDEDDVPGINDDEDDVPGIDDSGGKELP